MASLWLVEPSSLPQRRGTVRKIRIARQPLIDLEGLKAAITRGVLSEDDVWLATRKCDQELQALRWTRPDLLDCIACLRPDDHRGAEWCCDSSGRWHACDAYRLRYDEARRCRDPRALEFYLKFSIDEEGSLLLVMVSAHLSR